jgi:membrane protease YdiL (CAAX protease family)
MPADQAPLRAPDDSAALGPAQALLAYVVLLAGFLHFAVAAQKLDLVAGLWASEAIAIALPACIWLRAAGAPLLRSLAFAPPSPRWLGIAVATSLLNQPVVAGLEQLAHSLAPEEWVAAFDQKNLFLTQVFSGQPWAMTLTVAIAAPLGEEIFFRGFALPAFLRGLGPLAAVLVQGALFSFLHFDGVGFLGLWEIGVWLGVLRLASGSLWVPILGHALNNLTASASFLLGIQDPAAPPPLWLLAAGPVVAIPLGWAALRALRAIPRDAPGAASAPRPALRHGRALPLWILWLACVAPSLVQLGPTLARAALRLGR